MAYNIVIVIDIVIDMDIVIVSRRHQLYSLDFTQHSEDRIRSIILCSYWGIVLQVKFYNPFTSLVRNLISTLSDYLIRFMT